MLSRGAPLCVHRLAIFLLLLLAVNGFAGTAVTAWQCEATRGGVVISSRTPAGSSVKEFRGVGEIEAPSSVVFAVLNDPEAYPSFMPYVAEIKVLQRTKDSTVAYQRLSVPLISDRDYTVRSEHSESQGLDGPVYLIQWSSANALGPPPQPGVQRVQSCTGSWLLEATSPGVTRATYLIQSETGGAIPAFIANHGSQVAIRKVFAAVRKEVLEPKYAESK